MAERIATVDDLDLAGVVGDMERAFGLSFANDAFYSCVTVGQVFDVVWAALPEAAKSGGKCPSQMTFYRLRAALGDRALRPDTPLSGIAGFHYIRLQKGLRREGWEMPARCIQPVTWWLSLLSAVAVGAEVLRLARGDAALMSALATFVVVPWVLHRWVFTSGGPPAKTLGELAHAVADGNAGRLRMRGGTFSRRLLWDHFVRVLANFAEDGPVVRGTRIVSG